MSQPIFRSNRGDFNKKHGSFVDMALGRLAMYVEIGLKTTAGMPVDTGNMKSQTRHFKNRVGNWRTEVDTDYAAVQELGVINGHPIRNYTTSGTSSGFFRRAIDSMLSQKEQIILETKRALNL